MEVDRLADPEFHEEGRLRTFVLGESADEQVKGGEEVVKPLVMLEGGGSAAGKTCTDEMCF